MSLQFEPIVNPTMLLSTARVWLGLNLDSMSVKAVSCQRPRGDKHPEAVPHQVCDDSSCGCLSEVLRSCPGSSLARTARKIDSLLHGMDNLVLSIFSVFKIPRANALGILKTLRHFSTNSGEWLPV